jgi:hypothetical protein
MAKKTAIIGMLVGLLIIALPAWSMDLTPGKYEITSKVDMPGMPGGMPPTTITQCLTEQDPVPHTSAGANGCNITNMTTEGDTVKYTLVCEQQGMQNKSSGEMTYKGENFYGTTQTKMGPSGGDMTITTKISGKRIGECD